MTLLELCEPLFQYVCRLSRMSRTMGGTEYAVVRSNLRTLLAEIPQKAARDGRLANQAKRMELPLIFFVDFMVIENRLKFSQQWQKEPLAYELNELAGDEKFFDLLDATLKDNSEDASECLAVFYVCVGLGFAGIYDRQPEQLREYMNKILARVRHKVDLDQTVKICMDSYDHTDTRDLRQPPGMRLAWVIILFVFLSFSMLIVYFWMFSEASQDLRHLLREISRQETSAQ